jgi:hypothetical protein
MTITCPVLPHNPKGLPLIDWLRLLCFFHCMIKSNQLREKHQPQQEGKHHP